MRKKANLSDLLNHFFLKGNRWVGVEDKDIKSLAKNIKDLMKKSFEAGIEHAESKYDRDYMSESGGRAFTEVTPTEPDFDEWFKKKYG